jgi:uncharacterized membrane protein YedE/YeeE
VAAQILPPLGLPRRAAAAAAEERLQFRTAALAIYIHFWRTPRRQLNCYPRAAMAQIVAPFAPAAIGGAALGTLVLGRLLVSGRILGCSEAFKIAVRGAEAAPGAPRPRPLGSLLFVGGMVVGGAAVGAVLPSAMPALPAALAPRLAAAGLLVGIGTSYANGCTSGHGICGLARLSLRSFAATCTFMAAGALAAWLSGAPAVLGVAPGLTLPAPAPGALTASAAVLAAAVALQAAAVLAVRAAGGALAPRVEIAHDAATGVLFAAALGAAGMLDPATVCGFLAPLAGAWAPQLAAVMGGALAVALPGTQLRLRARAAACTAALPRDVDARLIVGSALFGAGWGVGGVCPGPGVAALATGTPAALVFAAAMAAGVFLAPAFEPALFGVDAGVKSA